MNSSAPLRVLCVDDLRSFADALAIALCLEDEIVSVQTAPDVATALLVLRDRPVDVVVMDLDLPHVDGVEGTRRIKHDYPTTRVVVLTAIRSVEARARAIAAGADGYLDKDAVVDDVLAEIRAGPGRHGGQLRRDDLDALRMTVAERIVDREGAVALTDRERDVLGLLVSGLDSTRIAQQLAIRTHTCRGYIRNLLVKLDAHSQLEAVAIAGRRGVVHASAAS